MVPLMHCKASVRVLEGIPGVMGFGRVCVTGLRT